MRIAAAIVLGFLRTCTLPTYTNFNKTRFSLNILKIIKYWFGLCLYPCYKHNFIDCKKEFLFSDEILYLVSLLPTAFERNLILRHKFSINTDNDVTQQEITKSNF